jgi:hypothetical protein
MGRGWSGGGSKPAGPVLPPARGDLADVKRVLFCIGVELAHWHEGDARIGQAIVAWSDVRHVSFAQQKGLVAGSGVASNLVCSFLGERRRGSESRRLSLSISRLAAVGVRTTFPEFRQLHRPNGAEPWIFGWHGRSLAGTLGAP